MRVHHIRGLPVLALALCAQRASAFLDPPYITPDNPTVDDTIYVNVYGGECDALSTGIVPPIIEQGEEDITILFTGIHEDDPEWCNIGIGTQSFSFGQYAAGPHTLRVERRYMTVFGTWEQETLGIIPFTVSGAPPRRPIETPTLSGAGLVGLFLALIAAPLLAAYRKFYY